MANLRQQRIRVRDRELEVFRRDPVGNCAGLIEITGPDQRSAACERSLDDGRTRLGREQALDGGIDPIEKGRVR